MYKHQITIEIDESMLASYSNEYLATCWHLAQANPADGFATSVPGELGVEQERRARPALAPLLA